MKNKKHTKRIEEIAKRTHENQYEKYVEEDFLYVLINIAESLAVIADYLEGKEDKDATSL